MSWRRQQGEGGSHSGYYSQPWKNHWSSLQKKRKPQDHSVSRACLGKAILYEVNDAKSWFWAEINGLPCNISLPDPDAYTDDVDWSLVPTIDPEVILDLERSHGT
ncbi:hypothetical protein L3X38_022014 [Prunus dulcis]|uniref:Uncharacterized protein n=1 Tax=Prunus dulcis TaxID=3755 RepID=A0AAD4VWE8_PRUDU|nr:hypothetical protein L3X38_022014 [Prunus dulcis]